MYCVPRSTKFKQVTTLPIALLHPSPLSCPFPSPPLVCPCRARTEPGQWGSPCGPLSGEKALSILRASLSVLLTQLNRLHMRRGKRELCEEQPGLGMEPCAGERWPKACISTQHCSGTRTGPPAWVQLMGSDQAMVVTNFSCSRCTLEF